jgi:hypothetical protein
MQGVQASVGGIIRDGENGRALAEAVVSLSDLNRSVVSDSSGRYTFLEVPPGPQHLSVRRIGYAPRTLHALVPREGRLEIDITIQPLPLELPALVVRSSLPVRGLEASDSTTFPDRGVSLAAVRNDPLLSEPDGLLALGGGEVVTDPESPGGLNVRGAAADQTGYLLDGVPVFSPYHSAGTFSAWNPDALERLQLSSAFPSLAYPEALSGTVAAVTRTPGPVISSQGAVSTTQARMAVDGPLGSGGAGFLLSLRAGFPGWLSPGDDFSYLRGQTQDLLAKLEMPFLGGSSRVLLYDAGNTIGSAVKVEPTGSRPLKNDFEWGSRSVGVQWRRQVGWARLRLEAWSASTEAEATWVGESPFLMVAERVDHGVVALLERSGARSTSSMGLRLERSRTAYHSTDTAGSAPALQLEARTPVTSVFLEHGRELCERLAGSAAISGAFSRDGFHTSLRSQIRWQLARPLLLSATYLRAHQYSQSLRNSESVVGNVFPAELYIGAGSSVVPVARNDRGIVALDYRASSGLRLGIQAYLSGYTGLLLVAPKTGEPFATEMFTTGSGTAPGVSLDAALSGARYGLLARYGWQRVRLEHADSSYSPSYGASHLAELGAIVFPSATSSVRLGLKGSFGRQTTGVMGDFEWEACNLLDRGCEFGGNPQATGALGGTRLPAYIRLDLGVRKHWHLNLAGKDVLFAVYGTLTNLLGRTNILTYATDPTTGRRTPIEMRPRAPLVLGFDWRF